MRRGVAVAAACATLLLAAGFAAAATATPDHVRTVTMTIHFSRFDLASLQVAPGETVRFVVTNTDPIDHEFLVGDAAMQAVHEAGTEAHHGARPGEISVPAGATVETTFTFPAELAPGMGVRVPPAGSLRVRDARADHARLSLEGRGSVRRHERARGPDPGRRRLHRRRGAPVGQGRGDPRRSHRGGRHRGRRPRSRSGPATSTSTPRRMRRPGVPGRAHPRGVRRPQPAEREPRRPARPRRLPRRASRDLRRREPRRCRGSWAADGTARCSATGGPRGTGPRRDRARPAGVPDEHRRARRMGELAGARARGHHAPTRPTRGTATSCATPTGRRPAACRRAPRTPFCASSCRAERSRNGRPVLRAQQHLHALGITAGRTRGSSPTCSRPTASWTTHGELSMRVVASLWWDRHRGHGAGRRAASSSASGRPAARVNARHDQDHARRLSRERHRLDARAVRGRTSARRTAPGIAVRRRRDAPPRPSCGSTRAGSRSISTRWGTGRSAAALDAVEAARAANGGTTHRHHIAHLQLPDPADIPRLRQLGVVANIQPYWAQPDPAIEKLDAPARRARARAPVPDRRRSCAAARSCVRQRLAGHHAEPLARDARWP